MHLEVQKAAADRLARIVRELQAVQAALKTPKAGPALESLEDKLGLAAADLDGLLTAWDVVERPGDRYKRPNPMLVRARAAAVAKLARPFDEDE